MLVEKLYDLADNKKINADDLAKLNLLIEAINDWPEEAISVEEFLEQLQKDQDCIEITFKSIEKRNKRLKIYRDAWKMESYESVINLIQLCKGKSLNLILLDFADMANKAESNND